MVSIKKLTNYRDDNGNEIRYDGNLENAVLITFKGKNNKLKISPEADIRYLNLQFDRDNARVEIGGHKKVMPLRLFGRLGADSGLRLGDNVSTTERLRVNASEGASISIGNDVLIAEQVEIRCDDSHPIFDVHSGKRVNPARSITVGSHVWIAKKATIMGGANIGSGSVIGLGSVVTKNVPNNSIVAGVPARVVRRNIAWERPHLSMTSPSYKPDASTIRTSDKFWNPTVEIRQADGSDTQLRTNPLKGILDQIMNKIGYIPAKK